MPFRLRMILEPRIAAWLGVMSLLCVIVSTGISIALSPWFSWTRNALSDLGVSEVAPVFNVGLIITGILLSIFATSLALVEHANRLGLLGAMGLAILGLSTVGVGIFSEAFIVMHIFFALSCFFSLISSSILLGVRFASEKETRTLGALGLLAGMLGMIVWSTIRFPGVASKEALGGLPFIVWFIPLSLWLYRKGNLPSPKVTGSSRYDSGTSKSCVQPLEH